MLYAATKVFIENNDHAGTLHSYMVVLTLSRLKKVGLNLLVFANP